MIKHKKIKAGKKYIDAVLIKLSSKNLIVLKGSRGYIMCGYLDLKAANKFKDAAVKITGVNSIKDALNAEVSALSRYAGKLGIYKGQSVREVLKIIA